MPLEVQGTFVSQKINKVRWIPEDYVETKWFFTGSWDDDVNSVKVWTFESALEDEEVEYPRALSEYQVDGDVTQIKFIEKTKIAVSTSDGAVRVLEISAYDKQSPLREVYKWDKLHNYGFEQCSCTSLDTFEGDIATIGEDGNINILNGRQGNVIQTIREADSCSLHSVCFIKHNEVITGNIRGHMKIWDLRTSSNKPAASFLVAGDELAATCVVQHPTRPHSVLAGGEGGALALWDLRVDSLPTSLLTAHSAAVTEMQFHPENPNKLLTCSVSGELWDWNMEWLSTGPRGAPPPPPAGPLAAGLTALMQPLHRALNSLHCDTGRVLCGADNEAVYLINNFKY